MKNLLKVFIVLSLVLLTSISVFAKELKFKNVRDEPVRVWIYYHGEYLDSFVVPSRSTKSYDIGDTYCNDYRYQSEITKNAKNNSERKFQFDYDCGITLY